MTHPRPSGSQAVPDGTTNAQRRTALVLGGGGSTGNAWLIGVLAGLAGAGLEVNAADLIVGTSAGATAAAQLSGALCCPMGHGTRSRSRTAAGWASR